MGSGAAAAAPRTIGGRYELESLLGKGGIGEVWRAKHIALNSHVAIKFLQGGSVVADSAKRRFAAEAQITAQLKTPNAVQVFDFGVTEEGQPYLVMELLEGETLGRRIERLGRLGMAETARLLGPCARALHRAHQLGIVHRDFKPDNVIICSADHEGTELVKVLDFGIAKLAGALDEHPSPAAPEPSRNDPIPSFTKTGTVLGTPLYMAPEQARDAAEVDLRADIWAFGVVAFECLTGVPPFTAPTIEELFVQIRAGTHPRACEYVPTLPAGFDQWFDVACAPDRERRFASASAAWKELAQILPTEEANMRTSAPGVTSSDQRTIVVSTERISTDVGAATVDAPRRPSVPPRVGRTGLATLQRVTLHARETERSQQPVVRAASLERRPSGKSKAAWLLVPCAGLFLAAGAWRLADHPGPNVGTSTAAASTPVPASPPPATTGTGAAQVEATAPSAGASTSTAPAASVATLPAPTAGPLTLRRFTSGGRPVATPSPGTEPKAVPSAAQAPPPVAPSPPSPPPPATAAAPAADPGSYR